MKCHCGIGETDGGEYTCEFCSCTLNEDHMDDTVWDMLLAYWLSGGTGLEPQTTQ